ncbi:hypothetical protein Tco_1532619 [Tanacetum coccineum]
MVDDDFGETRIWHVLTSWSLFFPVVNLVSNVFPNQFRIIYIFSVEHPSQYVNPGLSKLVIACSLSRKALVDNSCQSSPWLVHMIHKHVGVPVQWTLVAKIKEKGKCSFIIWNICKVFTFHSWTYIKYCPKDFSIDNTLLVGYEEFIRICVLNLLDGAPELLHKDFRDICRYGKSLEARGIFDYVNDHLKHIFLLWHSGFQSDISRADLDSLSRRNPLFITSSSLKCFLRIYDFA